MSIKNIVRSVGTLLPGIAVAVAVAGGLSGYEAPVFDTGLAQNVEASLVEDTEKTERSDTSRSASEKKKETVKKVSLDGAVDLADCADGTYEGSGVGFQNGKTTVRVTIKDHKITAIEVVSHQDTESYFASARNIIDTILSTQSLDVDTISGATYSSNGIIEAVSNALKRAAGQSVSDDYSGNDGSAAAGGSGSVSVSASTPDTLTDGTYTGSAEGFSGLVTVSVTVSGGKITNVDVLSHSDTPSYFSSALVLCDLIVQNNGVNGLDAVSGATYSSRGILQAVANALSGAGGSSSSGNSNSGNSTNSNSSSNNNSGSGSVDLPTADTPDTLKDGTYTGSGEGFGGTTVVSVTVENGKIAEIRTISHQDTPSYYESASVIIDQIVNSNGISGVNAVSGATYSCRGIMQAVSNALAQAGAQDTSNNSSGGNSNNNSKDPIIITKPDTGNTSDPATVDEDTTIIKGMHPYLDGIYTGSGEGNGGEVTVSIVIKDKTLTAIAVVSAEDEDEPFLTNAKGILNSILLQQSTDVDVISGATFTSEGILEAVNNALAQADEVTKAAEKDDEDVSDDNNETGEDSKDDDGDSDHDENDSKKGPYTDGIYTASVLIDPGEDADFLPYTLSMELTIEKGSITAISNVTGSGEGYEDADLKYINRALNGTSKQTGIAQQVFDANGLEGVQTISGATWTSEALIDMVQEILKIADKGTEV